MNDVLEKAQQERLLGLFDI